LKIQSSIVEEQHDEEVREKKELAQAIEIIDK